MQIKKGLEIVISDLELEKNAKLNIKGACSVFELNYCLSGDKRAFAASIALVTFLPGIISNTEGMFPCPGRNHGNRQYTDIPTYLIEAGTTIYISCFPVLSSPLFFLSGFPL
ncbi:hypothetical protein [Desulfocucumis palustris]|uniref:hypothetical protein n=1 Tax=Desulfocucumis palustris TaxID=1898651 RepID=UPI000CEA2FDA|nr:hypothetical protein [Desulfocucumis palustris]